MEFSVITEELIYASVHLGWRAAYILVPVGVGKHSVFGYPALGVGGGQRDLVQVHHEDLVPL